MLSFRRSRKLKQNQAVAATEPIDKKTLSAELLTDDLIAEILSWLPPKFAGRCKVVCKLWRAIILSPHFIEQHMQRQDDIIVDLPPPLPPPLPVLPPHQQPFIGLFYLRGLSLERNLVNKGTYRIRNYVTNQVFTLPDLNVRLIYGSMCHLPTSDEYKVLNLHRKQNNSDIGLKVLTKGIDVSWRCVEIPSLLSCSKNNDQNGNVNSRTIGTVSYIIKCSKSGLKMVAFQIEDESFVEISLPWTVKFCATGSPFSSMIWESNVSLGRFVGEELHIWVLQDYRTSKWDERKIVFPSALLKKYPLLVTLIPYGMTDGDIVMLIAPNLPFRVVYNTKTACLSKVGHGLKPSLVSV